MARSCDNCSFAVLEDFGYSNYTVEGTTFSCAKRLHPDGSFDRFYGEEQKLKFAEQCSDFSEGEPVSIDVDHEDLENLSPAQRAIYDMHCELPARAQSEDASRKRG